MLRFWVSTICKGISLASLPCWIMCVACFRGQWEALATSTIMCALMASAWLVAAAVDLVEDWRADDERLD